MQSNYTLKQIDFTSTKFIEQPVTVIYKLSWHWHWQLELVTQYSFCHAKSLTRCNSGAQRTYRYGASKLSSMRKARYGLNPAPDECYIWWSVIDVAAVIMRLTRPHIPLRISHVKHCTADCRQQLKHALVKADVGHSPPPPQTSPDISTANTILAR